MAARGAQPGNDNATKAKVWREAIRKALCQDKQALERLARKLIAKAEEGDMVAIKEIGDRMDGKPSQALDADVGGKLIVEIRNFDG